MDNGGGGIMSPHPGLVDAAGNRREKWKKGNKTHGLLPMAIFPSSPSLGWAMNAQPHEEQEQRELEGVHRVSFGSVRCGGKGSRGGVQLLSLLPQGSLEMSSERKSSRMGLGRAKEEKEGLIWKFTYSFFYFFNKINLLNLDHLFILVLKLMMWIKGERYSQAIDELEHHNYSKQIFRVYWISNNLS